MPRPPDLAAFFDLEIRSAELDRRAFKGIANTREADLLGDIVEPKGATYKLPLPLLSQHRQDHPIGHVTKARLTDKGLEIEAEGPEESGDHDMPYIRQAWAQIRSRLVRGLSIGFKPVAGEIEEILDKKGKWTGGLRFKKWIWLELSTVTVPANPGATLELRNYARGDLQAAQDREIRRALLEGRLPAGDSPRDSNEVRQRAAAAIVRTGRTLKGIRQ